MKRVLDRLLGAKRVGRAWSAQCPAHDDRTPSLSIAEGADGRALVMCHAGCELDEVLKTLGLGTPDLFPHQSDAPPRHPPGHRRPSRPQTRIDASAVWDLALESALDDDQVDQNADAFAYLVGRGLSEAWGERVVGFLHDGHRLQLPSAIASWPGRGYRIICPTIGPNGEFQSLQARRIVDRTPKVMSLPGVQLAGSVFANETGQRMLRCEKLDPALVVVIGEGLTDFLALSASAPTLPVLSCPGTSTADRCIGAWCRDRSLILAFDDDDAGGLASLAVVAAARSHGAHEISAIQWPAEHSDACEHIASCGVSTLNSLLTKDLTGDRCRIRPS